MQILPALIGGLLAASTAIASPPTVLLLERDTPQRIEYEEGKFTTVQLLKREMLRQALLITARHEMNAATRDATLREPMTLRDPATGRLLHLHATEYYNERLNVRITDADGREVLLDFDIPFGQTGAHNYEDIATAAEQWSRQGAVGLLQMVGFESHPHAVVADGPASPESLEALSRLNFFSQYEALRLAHEQVAADGQSPQRLSVLTRTYANLGQMTRHHWNSSFKAYRARGVMYAQRLIALYPDDPASWWNSAYAWAMFGHHGIALERLARGDELAGDTPRPAWADSIDDFLHFRRDELIERKEEQTAQLNMLLAFLAVEHNGVESVLMETGKQALSVNPESYRVIDAMIEEAGVSYNHRLTVFGPMVLLSTAGPHLRDLADLPPDVDALMPAPGPDAAWEPIDLSRVSLALVDAAQDPGVADPSWATLGRLMEETQFRQAQRRIRFMAYSWGVEVGEQLQELEPVIAEHPYAPVIHSYGLDWRRDLVKLKPLFADMPVTEPHRWMRPIDWQTDSLADAGDERFKAISDDMWRHADATYDETAQRVDQYGPDIRVSHARWFNDISPYAPLRVSTLIEDDWDNSQNQIDDWRRDFGEQPSVMSAFAKQLEKTGQRDEAISLWEKYLLHAPDAGAFRRLAGLYLRQGDEERWLSTLNRHLDAEDYGLSHERTRVIIAESFVERGQPTKALPYAEAAAESWASWSMTCAAGVNDLLGRFDRAELWWQRNSERYDSASDKWFRWCKQTGLGNVDAARRVAWQKLASVRGREKGVDWYEMGLLYYLDDRKADALRSFEKSTETLGDRPFYWMHMAIVADQLGDSDGRDAALERAVQCENDGAGSRAMKPLAELVLKTYREQDPPVLDAVAMDEITAGTTPVQQINLNFMAAMFLAGNGQDDAAQERLMRASLLEGKPLVENMSVIMGAVTLSRYELLRRGVGPEHFIVGEADGADAAVLAVEPAIPQRTGPPPAPR